MAIDQYSKIETAPNMDDGNSDAVTTSSETLTPPSTANPPPLLPPLPFELVVEILCRLPVKPLLQFRCVCKSWNSLISDPKFAEKHLRCSPTDFTRHRVILSYCMTPEFPNSYSQPEFRENVLIAYSIPSLFNAETATATATATELEFPMKYPNQFHSIVGSCDGIFCLDIDRTFAVLWNPSIRRFKKLPSLEISFEEFQLEYCHTSYGFGYDHLAERYKVVAVFHYPYGYDYEHGYVTYKTQVNVYTLGIESWRRIREFPLLPSGIIDDYGQFVSGTINWLAHTDDFSNWFMISLDLANEGYQELSQPDYGHDGGNMLLSLGVLRDCLCIISAHDKFSYVWLLKEYGNQESWTKLFNMGDLGGLSTNPIHVSEDDEVLLKEFGGQIVLYNFRDGSFKTPQIQNMDGCMTAKVYLESLISPCSLY